MAMTPPPPPPRITADIAAAIIEAPLARQTPRGRRARRGGRASAPKLSVFDRLRPAFVDWFVKRCASGIPIGLHELRSAQTPASVWHMLTHEKMPPEAEPANRCRFLFGPGANPEHALHAKGVQLAAAARRWAFDTFATLMAWMRATKEGDSFGKLNPDMQAFVKRNRMETLIMLTRQALATPAATPGELKTFLRRVRLIKKRSTNKSRVDEKQVSASVRNTYTAQKVGIAAMLADAMRKTRDYSGPGGMGSPKGLFSPQHTMHHRVASRIASAGGKRNLKRKRKGPLPGATVVVVPRNPPRARTQSCPPVIQSLLPDIDLVGQDSLFPPLPPAPGV